MSRSADNVPGPGGAERGRRAGGPRAVVFLNGEYAADEAFYRALAGAADLVVAADGGAAVMRRLGIRPDVVVGDLDSLSLADAGALGAQGVPLKRHPLRKDETDAELAVAEALKRGVAEVTLTGALGGAFDHALGAVALLRRLARNGVAARIAEPGLTAVVARAPALYRARAPRGTRFSLAPLTATTVVSLRGFEYELQRGRLLADAARGLGNSLLRSGAVVELHEGAAALLLFHGGPAALSPAEGRRRK